MMTQMMYFSDLYNYLKTDIEVNDMSDSIYIEKGSLNNGTSDGDGNGGNKAGYGKYIYTIFK